MRVYLTLKQRMDKMAVEYGTAVAKDFAKYYSDHPEWFPKGIESLPEMVAGIAATGLFTCWVFYRRVYVPSEEYELVASNAAVKTIKELLNIP